MQADFENLTPEKIINAVEAAIGQPMTGLTSPLPSYINRVYELQAQNGKRVIAKFYRPGRWTKEALLEEHVFVLDCAEDEVPVIAPMTLSNGATIDSVGGIFFAVFPKRFGREFEITEDEDWRRLGRVTARIHNAGKKKEAKGRVRLHPHMSTAADIRHLTESGFISSRLIDSFQEIGHKVVDLSATLFEGIEFIRLHGDCHRGNILHRPGEGLMVIDFDDMMTGPPVHDIWMLLPEYAYKCQREIDLILEGYEMFRTFDRHTLRLIEPLRAMRIIYFLAWCSRQANDFRFKSTFPDWGSEGFWKKEIADLTRQVQRIAEHQPPTISLPTSNNDQMQHNPEVGLFIKPSHLKEKR